MNCVAINDILIPVIEKVLAMKKKISHSSLDDFILEQIEGTKVLNILFKKIHKITKNPDIKAISNLGTKFCKELHADCKNFEKILDTIKKILDQFFQDTDKS